MSDEPGSKALEVQGPVERPVRTYSEEQRAIMLAALDMNGGNVNRTALAFGVPAGTLRQWKHNRDRMQSEGIEPRSYKESRGDLAAKLEDKVHSAVESITPETIEKATLSQRSVFIGIGIDKIKILRSQGLDPDPAAELCRLLGINRAQLPESLELQPGEELPPGFGHIIEMTPTGPDSYEPQPQLSPSYHHPDLGNVLTHPDQDRLPSGYVRVVASDNGLQADYTLKLSELRPTHPDVISDDIPNDSSMLDSIPDDDTEN